MKEVTISLDEYKELLETKGRYLELKEEICKPIINYPSNITYTDWKSKDSTSPYVTTVASTSGYSQVLGDVNEK